MESTLSTQGYGSRLYKAQRTDPKAVKLNDEPTFGSVALVPRFIVDRQERQRDLFEQLRRASRQGATVEVVSIGRTRCGGRSVEFLVSSGTSEGGALVCNEALLQHVREQLASGGALDGGIVAVHCIFDTQITGTCRTAGSALSNATLAITGNVVVTGGGSASCLVTGNVVANGGAKAAGVAESGLLSSSFATSGGAIASPVEADVSHIAFNEVVGGIFLFGQSSDFVVSSCIGDGTLLCSGDVQLATSANYEVTGGSLLGGNASVADVIIGNGVAILASEAIANARYSPDVSGCSLCDGVGEVSTHSTTSIDPCGIIVSGAASTTRCFNEFGSSGVAIGGSCVDDVTPPCMACPDGLPLTYTFSFTGNCPNMHGSYTVTLVEYGFWQGTNGMGGTGGSAALRIVGTVEFPALSCDTPLLEIIDETSNGFSNYIAYLAGPLDCCSSVELDLNDSDAYCEEPQWMGSVTIHPGTTIGHFIVPTGGGKVAPLTSMASVMNPVTSGGATCNSSAIESFVPKEGGGR